MLNRLAWRKLQSPEISGEVQALRDDTLRLFVSGAAVAYLAWHLTAAILSSPEDGPRLWALFVVVSAGLGCAYLLQSRRPALAPWTFLASLVLSATVALALFQTHLSLVLYPPIVLLAVVLLDTLAGAVVSATSLTLVAILSRAELPGFVTVDSLVELAVALALTLVVAWGLRRNTVVAIGWALNSYSQALAQTKDAQQHRAQLVQALKQLDSAYYRLERANAALEIAWKRAGEAERAKSEFVTNISHELRTPLNLIIGFSEMIVTSPETYGEPLPQAYRADLFSIYRSAQHLLVLTDDVIDLARVGAGRLALVREPVILADVIRDACDIVREYVAAKGIWLKQEIGPDLSAISVDRVRIRQVLLNLLTNAARFTEHGGISISAEKHDDSIEVKVADTGRGISRQDLPKVFDEFYHEDGDRASERRGIGGAGLGLPISKQLVEMHGGQMGVESDPGAGTTFFFTLPLDADFGPEQGCQGTPRRTGVVSRWGERVVVLVSADRHLARFVQRHVRGYRVVPASDVAAGLAAATEYRASAVIADPDALSAEECADFPVPVIRLPLPNGERMAGELGVVAYLTKPVTRQDLVGAINRVGRPTRRVLIADDDPRFVRLITLMLKTPALQPEQIVVAHNGREALELARADPPDLALLDLVMPELSGDQVVAAMSDEPALGDVPVILVSGQDRPEWLLRLRGELTVTRPEGFRLEELLGAVEALLGTVDPPRAYLP